jgi:hypothetical protein
MCVLSRRPRSAASGPAAHHRHKSAPGRRSPSASPADSAWYDVKAVCEPWFALAAASWLSGCWYNQANFCNIETSVIRCSKSHVVQGMLTYKT